MLSAASLSDINRWWIVKSSSTQRAIIAIASQTCVVPSKIMEMCLYLRLDKKAFVSPTSLSLIIGMRSAICWLAVRRSPCCSNKGRKWSSLNRGTPPLMKVFRQSILKAKVLSDRVDPLAIFLSMKAWVPIRSCLRLPSFFLFSSLPSTCFDEEMCLVSTDFTSETSCLQMSQNNFPVFTLRLSFGNWRTREDGVTVFGALLCEGGL